MTPDFKIIVINTALTAKQNYDRTNRVRDRLLSLRITDRVDHGAVNLKFFTTEDAEKNHFELCGLHGQEKQMELVTIFDDAMVYNNIDTSVSLARILFANIFADKHMFFASIDVGKFDGVESVVSTTLLVARTNNITHGYLARYAYERTIPFTIFCVFKISTPCMFGCSASADYHAQKYNSNDRSKHLIFLLWWGDKK